MTSKLPSATRLAQSILHATNFYTEAFTHSRPLHRTSFHTQAFTQQAFTQRSLYTQQGFKQRISLYTEKLLHTGAFTHSKLSHRKNPTQRSLDTQQAFTQRSPYTEKLLHREAFIRRSFYTASFYTEQAFTHRSFYTEKRLHRESFTQTSPYTKKIFPTEAFTHRSLYTQKLLHTEAFTQGAFTHRSFYAQGRQKLQLQNRILGASAKAPKNCNAICIPALHNTPRSNRLRSKRSKPQPLRTRGTLHRRQQPLYPKKHMAYGFVLRPPPQNEAHATFMQPLQCVLQHHVRIHAAIAKRFASLQNTKGELIKYA